MPKEDWENNPIHKILEGHSLWPFEDGDIKSVLDVACGLSLKSQYLGAPNIVGVDIYEPYLKAIETEVPYSVVKYDVRKLEDIFMENSFDVVYALDILEHLDKYESYNLIGVCKRIARKAVLVEMPRGYIPQNLDIQGFGAHEYQTHRCSWEPEDLERLGFICIIRPYEMQNVKRHTEHEVETSVELIDGIYLK